MEDSKGGRRRSRLNKQAWQALLARFDGAAMTVEEFCVREGLSRSSFTRWRSRRRHQASRVSAPLTAASACDTPKASFVDLGVLGSAREGEHTAMELRIELGGGMSLHLVRR
ncbi:MAG: IS66 family insertion sequence element accessory protein TnpA [Polaromonas sp.]